MVSLQPRNPSLWPGKCNGGRREGPISKKAATANVGIALWDSPSLRRFPTPAMSVTLSRCDVGVTKYGFRTLNTNSQSSGPPRRLPRQVGISGDAPECLSSDPPKRVLYQLRECLGMPQIRPGHRKCASRYAIKAVDGLERCENTSGCHIRYVKNPNATFDQGFETSMRSLELESRHFFALNLWLQSLTVWVPR